MKYSIEVVATASMSSVARGRLLESFARRFLETQNYVVSEEVRITGQEVDLLAVEQTTGERIIVECKAHRSTIAAEVIYKLAGQVAFNAFSAGWLISTFDLGKDAKGLRDANSLKAPEERRRLRLYDPADLVKRLIASGVIVDPNTLALPLGITSSDEAVLIISQWGEFWARVGLDAETRLRKTVVLFDGLTGIRCHEKSLNRQLQDTDTTLAELIWEVSAGPRGKAVPSISDDLQSIVQVPVADSWVDYRPARPQDFVGREQLQKDVIAIFDKACDRASTTRLFAVKGPSGMGKSSFALKVAQVARQHRAGKKYFVYAVDSRAATSRRFGELALYSMVRQAMKAGFISYDDTVSLGGASAPFNSPSSLDLLRELHNSGKVLCLIFDQFEELIYKEELETVFDEIRLLCDAVVEAQENVVIGFSWKTDGTIPPEHRAYHLWHNLADRRREFELVPLRPSEVQTALNRFSRELGQSISPQLRRTLSDHCQGYPWLLKKLCIHVLEQVRDGLDQGEILLRSLKIEELFDRDIQSLTAPEYECLKSIATEAPADFFKVAHLYGDVPISSLLDKRLIIRSGARLSVYWDIFRDFLLLGTVPHIPTTYIPQTNIQTYLIALRFLLEERNTTYERLAIKLKVSVNTADNIVRDLVMLGHAEASRGKGSLTLLSYDRADADQLITNFCLSHVVYIALADQIGVRVPFTFEEAVATARPEYSVGSVSEKLLSMYVRRIIQWTEAAGLIKRVEGRYELGNTTAGVAGLTRNGVVRQGQNFFSGEAPPLKALAALKMAQLGVAGREEIKAAYGRNSVYVLMNLGLIDSRGNSLIGTSDDAEVELKSAARGTTTVAIVEDHLRRSPIRLSGVEIGTAVKEHLGLKWSLASCVRSGTALRAWATWCHDGALDAVR